MGGIALCCAILSCGAMGSALVVGLLLDSLTLDTQILATFATGVQELSSHFTGPASKVKHERSKASGAGRAERAERVVI